MGSTLLELIQRATGELGLSIPNYVAGNTAQDTVQQMALLNAVGKEVLTQHPWQNLEKAYSFTTQFVSTTGDFISNSAVVTNIGSTTGVDTTYQLTGVPVPQNTFVSSLDSATQVTMTQVATATLVGADLNFCKTIYALPSDWWRAIDRTHWDKTRHWEMLGPETPQQQEFLKSGFISTGPRIRYWLQGGMFQIWPPLASNEYLGFQYISNAWVYSNAAAAQTAFLQDTDTCIFPDNLMVLGLKRKYFEIKGFDTTAFERDYMRELNICKAADAGSPTLSLAPRPGSILVGWENIPDSTYGFPTN